MTNSLTIVRRDDRILSVYRAKRHLGLIFPPMRAECDRPAQAGYLASPTMAEDQMSFATEAEAVAYFNEMK